jgi:hypothetical protein
MNASDPNPAIAWAPGAFNPHPNDQPPIAYRTPPRSRVLRKEFLPQSSSVNAFNIEAE